MDGESVFPGPASSAGCGGDGGRVVAAEQDILAPLATEDVPAVDVTDVDEIVAGAAGDGVVASAVPADAARWSRRGAPLDGVMLALPLGLCL